MTPRPHQPAVPAPPRTSATGIVQVLDLEAAELGWEAAPGVVVHGYGFNGQVPGPTIEATVGDTLLVRFTNRLPEPTSIHWHGLRIPAAMEGSGLGDAVRPAESLEYHFDLPDAGTFWYHPHVAEPTQLEQGLYGAVIVRGPDEPALEERLLIFDDVRINRRGRLAAPTPVRENMRGREGGLLLVNGVSQPHMQVTEGAVERWRLLNAADARYMRLSLAGHSFTVIGTAGGPLASPVYADEVLLVPGDRLDVVVGPFTAPEVSLDALPHQRGAGRPRARRLATLHTDPHNGSGGMAAVDLSGFGREVRPLTGSDTPPTRTIRLGGRLTLHGVEGRVNGQRQVLDDPVPAGELQVWQIVNDTRMDHPFHLHGFFFQILAVNGKAPPYLSWEDTVNVPASGTVLIAWLPDDRPGEWMYHCHNLEHHAVGMMARFKVVS